MSVKGTSVTIIGAGLSGLTCALLLNRAGFEVTLVEKKSFPFHRVCGEYISNEVLPFLNSIDFDVKALGPSHITQLAISAPSGNLFNTTLGLGGFGLSRYTLDNALYQKANAEGVNIIENTKATAITYHDGQFSVSLADNSTLGPSYVIAAYGKRSNLDKGRNFFYRRSPYLGVKYHVKTDFPVNLVQLDNFEGGYCGTLKIETDRYNLCYLIMNHHLKKHGSVEEMEKQVLFKNPLLRERFLNADFLNERAEVINEISFEKKPLVEDHILYCGDAAGMISPLCGNGMAMAVHSAKILSDTVIQHFDNRETLETTYRKQWKKLFENRLRAGRLMQQLFGSYALSTLAVQTLKMMPKISGRLIKSTHGKAFK